jgi:transcriptional regulator with XRE-family HTH domain
MRASASTKFRCAQQKSKSGKTALPHALGAFFMTDNVLWLRHHPRASIPAGLGTAEGQSQPSGQRSENQDMTSSYLRAVNVVAPASTRSKKRQSPAARRPKVVKLMPRSPAYADAQAKRLDRSSDSMDVDNSRTFPTLQAEKVGIFQLDAVREKSDKSAMTTVDQIRQRIRAAMEKAGDGPVALAEELKLSEELEIDRNYIRDFLEGKKSSMKPEILMLISERYNIPFKELLVKKEKQIRRRA